MKKKVCKRCKLFYDEGECPQCKVSAEATSWKGRLNILNIKKSEIAKKVGIETEGEYAIKVV